MHGKPAVRVAARTSQADTVQYKNNEQYNTQKKNSNTEYYNVTERFGRTRCSVIEPCLLLRPCVVDGNTKCLIRDVRCPRRFSNQAAPVYKSSVSLHTLLLSALSLNSTVYCHITCCQLSPIYFVAFPTAATVSLGARGGTARVPVPMVSLTLFIDTFH
jgi:hypothetical protein